MNNTLLTREILTTIVGFAATASLIACSSSAITAVHASAPTGVSTIILVHGAWGDGSSWSKVIPLLQSDGYKVVAVQLPLTSLADDSAVVQRALALQPGHVLLVGHSYGGSVITQAGSDPKVEGLVYVAAFAPDEGESAYSLGTTVPATPIMADFIQDATGFLKLTASGIATDFAQDLTSQEQAALSVTQGPVNAPNALAGPITQAPAWKTRPTWYIVANNDRVIGPALEQTMATRMKATVVNVNSSHVVMLAQPAALTALIEKAATTVAP